MKGTGTAFAMLLGLAGLASSQPRGEASDRQADREAREVVQDYLKSTRVLFGGCLTGEEWAIPVWKQSRIGLQGFEGSRLVPLLLEELNRTRNDKAPENAGLNLWRIHSILCALSEIRAEAEPALPVLIDLLRDPPKHCQYQIISILGNIGPNAKKALPLLEPLLANPEPFRRMEAITAFWQINRDPRRVVPLLRSILKEDPEQKESAISNALYILREIGPAAREALPEMRLLLHSEKSSIYLNAAPTIVKVNPGDKAAMDLLLTWLRNDEESTVRSRMTAAVVLSRIEKHRKEALGVAETFLKERGDDRSSFFYLVNALPLDPGRKVRLLVDALKDHNVVMRQTAALMLPQVGWQSKAAIIALQALEKDENKFVRIQAAAALRKINKP